MIIPVNDEYRFELDRYQWNVAKRRETRKKGVWWEKISHHRTLQQAAESLLEREVWDAPTDSVKAAVAAIEAASHTIAAAILASGKPDEFTEGRK